MQQGLRTDVTSYRKFGNVAMNWIGGGSLSLAINLVFVAKLLSVQNISITLAIVH